MGSFDSTLKREIDSLIAQGWEFQGNYWTNGPEGGHYEIYFERNGELKTFKSDCDFAIKIPFWRQLGLPF